MSFIVPMLTSLRSPQIVMMEFLCSQLFVLRITMMLMMIM